MILNFAGIGLFAGGRMRESGYQAERSTSESAAALGIAASQKVVASANS